MRKCQVLVSRAASGTEPFIHWSKNPEPVCEAQTVTDRMDRGLGPGVTGTSGLVCHVSPSIPEPRALVTRHSYATTQSREVTHDAWPTSSGDDIDYPPAQRSRGVITLQTSVDQSRDGRAPNMGEASRVHSIACRSKIGHSIQNARNLGGQCEQGIAI